MSKTPWPTKAVMNQIYEKHLWGGDEFDFYSGDGSHDPKIVNPYLEAVTFFLKSHDNALTVCDVGCGDFNIGKHLVNSTKKYMAIDIVDDLIEQNKVQFTADHLEFHCLNAAEDELPITDCIILRQVLQHLSNAEIQNIVKKMKHYKYIIITEHIPAGTFTPNKNIISGQGIRLKQNSGVDVLQEPFNLEIIEQSLLNEVVLGENKGKIMTILYKL